MSCVPWKSSEQLAHCDQVVILVGCPLVNGGEEVNRDRDRQLVLEADLLDGKVLSLNCREHGHSSHDNDRRGEVVGDFEDADEEGLPRCPGPCQ